MNEFKQAKPKLDLEGMHAAVEDAKLAIRLGDRAVRYMAGIAVGRLRLADVNTYHLAALKRELRD